MAKNQDVQQAYDTVRNLLDKAVKGHDGKPTVYTVLRHVSSSGMTRWLDLFVIVDGEPRRITWQVSQIIGGTYDRKREALKIGGCGMDMGFEAVYRLSHAINKEIGRAHVELQSH